MMFLFAACSVPWLLSVFVRWLSTRSERFFAPGVAVRVLAMLGVASTVSVIASFAAIGSVLITSEAPWQQTAGAAFFISLAWRFVEVVRHLARVASNSRSSTALAVHRRPDGVVVIDDDAPDAFSVPTSGGAVVLTTGLVRALSADELSVVVAHERAHLRNRHHLWVQCAVLAAIVNPYLGPIVEATRHAAERQADECAAGTDRRVAMRTVARVAVLCARFRRGEDGLTLAGDGGDVVRRVGALAAPAPSAQRWQSIVVCVCLVALMGIFSLALLDVVQDVFLPEPGEVPTELFR